MIVLLFGPSGRGQPGNWRWHHRRSFASVVVARTSRSAVGHSLPITRRSHALPLHLLCMTRYLIFDILHVRLIRHANIVTFWKRFTVWPIDRVTDISLHKSASMPLHELNSFNSSLTIYAWSRDFYYLITYLYQLKPSPNAY